MNPLIKNLWEIMRDCDIWGIAMLLHHICERREFTRQMIASGDRDERIGAADIRQFFESIAVMAEHRATKLQLQSTLDRVWNGGPFRMAIRTGMLTWQQADHELLVLRQAIEADLEKRKFVFLLPQKFEIISVMPQQWGHIWEAFPLCEGDSRHAAECYALEQNTACVFHLMRVAEFGLRALARRVGVKLVDKGKPQPIEFATWDKVIHSGIQPKIMAARALPHGPRKNRSLQFYSAAADNCTYIRDIWRNEISHTRKEYNDGEALGVFSRVRDFMHGLASNHEKKRGA